MKREESYRIYRNRLKDTSNKVQEEKALECFEKSIPKECKKCTLLEKDNFHKTVKCIYRSKNRCILVPYIGEKNERNNSDK